MPVLGVFPTVRVAEPVDSPAALISGVVTETLPCGTFKLVLPRLIEESPIFAVGKATETVPFDGSTLMPPVLIDAFPIGVVALTEIPLVPIDALTIGVVALTEIPLDPAEACTLTTPRFKLAEMPWLPIETLKGVGEGEVVPPPPGRIEVRLLSAEET